MSVDHYENFPVASWLCPPALRPAVAAIYHFARTADDLADEGDAPSSQRVQSLRDYRADLDAAIAGVARRDEAASSQTRHRVRWDIKCLQVRCSTWPRASSIIGESVAGHRRCVNRRNSTRAAADALMPLSLSPVSSASAKPTATSGA